MSGPGAVAVSRYTGILKSSSWMAAASLISMVLAAVRTKLFALWLGPSGVGLLGTLSSIADVSRSLASLGLPNSGVRHIAQAQAQGDLPRLYTCVYVLRMSTWCLGVVACLVLWLSAETVSRWTFGDAAHATAVAWLGLAVCLRMVADGQGALLQGLRRIPDLARESILGSTLSLVAAVACVYALGIDGVALSLVAISAVSAIAAWLYVRRVPLHGAPPPAAEFAGELSRQVRLGLSFMASSVVVLGAGYGVRWLLIGQLGLEQAGLYQAASALGTLYVSLVLQSMSADFFPRLVATGHDSDHGSRIVNEQVLVGVLLAGTGTAWMLTLAPLLISVFYSPQFVVAAETMRWVCLGMAVKVITWPVATLLLAREAQMLFLLLDVVWAVTLVGLAAWGVQVLGLPGVGMALAAAYLVQAALMLPLAQRVTTLHWTPTVIRTVVMVGLAVLGCFCANLWLTEPWAEIGGAAVALTLLIYSVTRLRRLVGR